MPWRPRLPPTISDELSSLNNLYLDNKKNRKKHAIWSEIVISKRNWRDERFQKGNKHVLNTSGAPTDAGDVSFEIVRFRQVMDATNGETYDE